GIAAVERAGEGVIPARHPRRQLPGLGRRIEAGAVPVLEVAAPLDADLYLRHARSAVTRRAAEVIGGPGRAAGGITGAVVLAAVRGESYRARGQRGVEERRGACRERDVAGRILGPGIDRLRPVPSTERKCAGRRTEPAGVT